jgi:hypothetical protein
MGGKKFSVGKKNIQLTLDQEKFCQLFATDKEFFGNGVQSYISAYGVDINKKGAYNVAKVHAHQMLTNSNIYKRISELLEEDGLNDTHVDKQLLSVITQHGDLTAKISAIREYNKLKQRIEDVVKHKGAIAVINVSFDKQDEKL